MSLSKTLLRFLSVLAILLAVTFTASAQYRAGIQGTVLDSQGAAVGGAKVTVVAKDTGLVQETTTDASGVYFVGRLAPGPYSVTIEKAGFKKFVLDNVPISGDQVNPVNATMDVGAVTESVTVNGSELPTIDTESGMISGTVTSDEIQKLPSFGRDVFQLTQLAPGAFGDSAQQSGGGSFQLPGTNSSASGATDGIFKTENAPQIIANGGQLQSNNITLDGVGITSVSWGGAAVVTPNEESVKEVQVVTNNYDAEDGRFSGAQIKVISQNGTNNFHGSLFFKMDRPGLNAYQSWNGPTGTPQRNTARFNQWGGSVGGPIWKNKLFFFFSYETIRNASTVTGTGYYETPAFLQLAPAGSIAAKYLTYPGEGVSSSSLAANGNTCAAIGLTEGVNCLTIPGKGMNIGSPLTTPLGYADPTYVTSANPGIGSGLTDVADIANYNTTGPNNLNEAQYNGRVDFNVTNRDLVAYSMYWVPVNTTSYNGPVRAANLYHHSAINDAFTLLWDHTFDPTLVNQARFNAAGWRWNEIATNPQEPWGLPTDNIDSYANISLQSYGPPGPSVFDQWTYNFKDTLTKVHGSHTIKLGGELTRLLFVQEAPWSARPTYSFHNMWDFLNDAPYNENVTTDPQTGVPTEVRKDTRSNIVGFFIQDTWKAKPNLTFNYGLRYDYFGSLTEKNDQLSTVVLGPGNEALSAMYLRIGGHLYNPSTLDYGPQLGFAWSPGGVLGHSFSSKLVIRGGFGIGYTGEEEAITLNGWGNPPFVSSFGALNTTFNATTGAPTGSTVVYAVPNDIHSFGPYPANPNAVLTFSGNNIPTSGSPVGVTAFPSFMNTPYTYRYSLEGQYEIGRNWIATLGYQGSTSHHLTQQYNVNIIDAPLGIPLNPMVNDVDYYSNSGNSNFNAFLAELEHRFSHSFSVDAQYRLAKSMDDGTQPYNVDNYQWDRKLAWGPSDWDIRNAIKVWGVYSPTFFHGDHSWMEKVFGGWNISGIMNWHTGFPWTPVIGPNGGSPTCNVVLNSVQNYNGSNCALRPLAYLGGAGDSLSNSTFKKPGANYPNGALSYFSIPSYTQVTAPWPAYGPIPEAPGVGRNTLRGPHYFDIDATLSKSFGLPRMPILGENAKLELRGNFYNLFNNLNLLPPGNYNGVNTAMISPNAIAGQPLCTGSITTNCNNNNSLFGMSPGALGSRTIELQARFNF